MRISHYIYTSLLTVALPLLTSCDDIAESDRLIEVEPIKVNRAVLVEEFSGQLCTNCPEGAEELEEIAHQLGDNNVVVVSLHCGVTERLGIHESRGGLATDFADSIFTHHGRPAQPSAVVERNTGVLTKAQWLTKISDALAITTPLTLTADAVFNPADSIINIEVKGQSSLDLSGNLHVWLAEDSIVATQRLVGGGYNEHHIFNHIFRTALTPVAGNPIEFAWNDSEPRTFRLSIKALEKWNVVNMSVVAFVDNAEGVLQTVKTEIR